MALSGDGRYIVSGSDDGTVAVWDLQTGARLHELTGHQRWGDFRGLERRRAAHRLGLRRWDGGGVGPEPVHGDELTGQRWGDSVLTATGGNRLGSDDGTVAVWDLQTGARLHELTGHQGWVTSVALSGDGRHIVSGSDDGTVAVWDLQTGARLHELTGHQGGVNSVALSGDGRHIVSGSDDGTVAVWDLQTGARLHELTGHHGGVNSVALERRRAVHRLGLRRQDGGGVGPPDRSARLATLALDGEIACLTMASGRPLLLVVGDGSEISTVWSIARGEPVDRSSKWISTAGAV